MSDNPMTCPECSRSEPEAKFGVRQARHNGTWCKDCTWAHLNPGEVVRRQQAADDRAAARAIVLAHYGERCACCGITETLVIDHIRGDGRAHSDEIGYAGGDCLYRWLIGHGLPDGFQTLCNRCNISKGPGAACKLDHAADARLKTSLTLYYDAMADGAKYLGQAGIARELGVTRQAVAKWRATFSAASGHPFPKPDAWIDGVPGWLPERVAEIRAWSESRPGQGSGGGRPRKAAG